MAVGRKLGLQPIPMEHVVMVSVPAAASAVLGFMIAAISIVLIDFSEIALGLAAFFLNCFAPPTLKNPPAAGGKLDVVAALWY